MTVISSPVTVEGDTHPDAMLGEELAQGLVELDTIGMDPEVEITDAAQGRLKSGDHPAQPRNPSQQRFPAMQNHLNGRERVRSSMFGNALGCLPDHIIRDATRPVPPALISGLVYVAVITRQIAPAVHLKNDLAQ